MSRFTQCLISKNLVTEFINAKVSRKIIHVKYLNTVKPKVRYVFSKVIECLEQNIPKQIGCKMVSSTKQMNRIKNIRIEICK